jgi:hypothetical protein
MDIQQLVAALTACTNPDANIRRAGEDAVKQVRHSFLKDNVIRKNINQLLASWLLEVKHIFNALD